MELLRIRKTLKNDGQLFVLYQDPHETDFRAAAPVKTTLIKSNFEIIDIKIKKFAPTSAFCLESRPIEQKISDGKELEYRTNGIT